MKDDCLKQDYVYLRQMMYFAQEVKNTLSKAKGYGIDFHDEMVVTSLAMHIAQIGKRLDSGKLSNEIQEKYSELFPWSKIREFSKKIYYDYDNIKSYEIVQIALKDVSTLISSLQMIMNEIEKELYRD